MQHQTIYVSATPADYELEKSGGVYVEQVIRPTGLLDPEIEVRPTKNQIDDLLEEIHRREELDERVLVTTLTKRMAEELAKYLARVGVRCRYIHSDVDTLERVQIMQDLREGRFDVLIGVNLLREGLDLPEVSLVAILDADKEGFLRSHRSLTQTIGRAARHVNGKAILYGDKITDSMRQTIDETARRRRIQQKYNQEHGITPRPIQKAINLNSLLAKASESPQGAAELVRLSKENGISAQAADEKFLSGAELKKRIDSARREMEKAAKNLDFISAAAWRDEMERLKALSAEK